MFRLGMLTSFVVQEDESFLLQKALSDANTLMFDERYMVLRVTAENDDLKSMNRYTKLLFSCCSLFSGFQVSRIVIRRRYATYLTTQTHRDPARGYHTLHTARAQTHTRADTHTHEMYLLLLILLQPLSRSLASRATSEVSGEGEDEAEMMRVTVNTVRTQQKEQVPLWALRFFRSLFIFSSLPLS